MSISYLFTVGRGGVPELETHLNFSTSWHLAETVLPREDLLWLLEDYPLVPSRRSRGAWNNGRVRVIGNPTPLSLLS